MCLNIYPYLARRKPRSQKSRSQICWIFHVPRKPRVNQSPIGWAIWRNNAIQENVSATIVVQPIVCNVLCSSPPTGLQPDHVLCFLIHMQGRQHTIPNTISDLAPVLEKLSQTTLHPPWQPKVQALGAESAQPKSVIKPTIKDLQSDKMFEHSLSCRNMFEHQDKCSNIPKLIDLRRNKCSNISKCVFPLGNHRFHAILP